MANKRVLDVFTLNCLQTGHWVMMWSWFPKSILLENEQNFVSYNSSFNTNKIILQEGDTIINDTGEICEISNNYFTSVASNIGFDDTIPTDFDTDDGFSAIINKYCRHPSIVKIKGNTLDKALIDFESITSRDVEKIINGLIARRHMVMTKCQWNYCRNVQNTLRQILLNWLIIPSVNVSFLTTKNL